MSCRKTSSVQETNCSESPQQLEMMLFTTPTNYTLFVMLYRYQACLVDQRGRGSIQET